jgi:hypothetical protein
MKLVCFDDFVAQCPHFYNAGHRVNNGYNCAHPKQEEKSKINTEYHNALDIGCCYCWSCPLGIEADEEDVKEYGDIGDEYEESQWILIDNNDTEEDNINE